ncbi:MAG TPA: hypothetical protein ENI23_06030, partial [bacterium]|nr:hypothetical protein [bacterium]
MPEVLEKLTAEELDKREQALLLSLKTPVDPNISTLAPSGLDIRERELIESLRAEGINTTEPELLLSPEEAFLRDQDIQKIFTQLGMEVVDPNDVILNYPIIKEPKIGFIEALKDTKPLHILPFVGSVWKALDLVGIMGDAQVLNTGQISVVVPDPTKAGLAPGKTIFREATKEEKQAALSRIEGFIINLEERQRRGISIGGRIAEGVVELPAFMVEFLLTGPIFKTGSATAKIAATKLLGRFAEKGTGKLAVRVAGAGFGTLARTAVNVPRILAGTVGNMTKGIQVTDDGAIIFADADKPFSALARSFADLYVENLTEIAGPSLKKGVISVGTGIGKKFPMIPKFTQAIAEKWISNGAARGITRTFGGFLKASASKVGYDGILEEMGEEQLGRIIRGVTGLEDFETIIPKWEDILVEAGIFAIPGVTISLAQTKIFRKDLP